MWPKIIDSTWFTVLYPISLIIVVAVGYYLSRRNYKRTGKIWNASGVEGGIIGIFALLISFTFASSGNAMKERANMLHQEADAVADLNRGFVYFRSGLQDTLKNYLGKYLDLQIGFHDTRARNPDTLRAQVTALGNNFWAMMGPLIDKDSDVESDMQVIMPSLNKLNSSFYKMIYSYEERTPLIIILLIIISSWLIGYLVGFMNGFHEDRRFLVPLIYIILVGLTMQAIRDLDDPYRGSIQPSFENLVAVKELLMK